MNATSPCASRPPFETIGSKPTSDPALTARQLRQQLHGLLHTYGRDALETALAGWYLDQAFRHQGAADNETIIAKAMALHRGETCFRLGEFSQSQRKWDEAATYYLESFACDSMDKGRRRIIGEYLLRYARQDVILDFYSRVRRKDPEDHLAGYVMAIYNYFEKLKEEIGGHLANSMPSSTGRPLLMYLSFWGGRYTDILLNIFLPALCAPGNLPFMSQQYPLHFLIFTDAAGAERLRSHPVFGILQRYLTPYVFVHPEPFFNFIGLYSRMTGPGWNVPAGLLTQAGTYAALEAGRRLDCQVLNLCPDHVVPQTFMTAAAAMLESHPDAVCGPGYRLYYNKEVIDALEADHRQPDGSLAVHEQDMIELLLRFLPEQNFVDSGQFSNFPIYLGWRVGEEGIVMHANHFHPWTIRGGALNGPMELSIDPIDGHFLNRKLMAKDRITIAPTAMTSLDLGDNPLCMDITPNRFNPRKVAYYFKPYITPLHERYFLQGYYYRRHGGEPSECFKQTAATAVRTVKEIIADAWSLP